MSERCGNCRFYAEAEERGPVRNGEQDFDEQDLESECRRYPPVRGDADYFGPMVGVDLLAGAYAHPVVNKFDWCGEWKLRSQ